MKSGLDVGRQVGKHLTVHVVKHGGEEEEGADRPAPDLSGHGRNSCPGLTGPSKGFATQRLRIRFLAMDFGTPGRLLGPLAMALVLGCGGSSQRGDADLERSEREKRAKAASGEASGGGGLPGPPSYTPAPRSDDPEVRRIEERLFANDGGRVVLKAVR